MVYASWLIAMVAVSGCDKLLGLDQVEPRRDGPVAIDAPNVTSWLGSYHYRKPITILPPTFAQLAHFPIAIVEGSDPQLAASARPDGLDLVFTGDDGVTVLPSEIERYVG